MSTCATPTVFALRVPEGVGPEDPRAQASLTWRGKTRNLIVALDIGTSKVAAMVAELFPDGRMDIIGTGGHESKGLKKGVVVNIEATVNAIQRTLEEAELMADCKIERVFTGIAGSHIKSFNSTGMVAIKDKEVPLSTSSGGDRDGTRHAYPDRSTGAAHPDAGISSLTGRTACASRSG